MTFAANFLGCCALSSLGAQLSCGNFIAPLPSLYEHCSFLAGSLLPPLSSLIDALQFSLYERMGLHLGVHGCHTPCGLEHSEMPGHCWTWLHQRGVSEVP